jgi:hypothetical protein
MVVAANNGKSKLPVPNNASIDSFWTLLAYLLRFNDPANLVFCFTWLLPEWQEVQY